MYDDRGLVPCVVQDWNSGEVLTLAYLNAHALELTERTGEMHFWSRSRNEIWHKGATSGHTLAVRALRHDCDADAIVALVEPAGPACHTGKRTCFHHGDSEPAAPHAVLPALERTIVSRRAAAQAPPPTPAAQAPPPTPAAQAPPPSPTPAPPSPSPTPAPPTSYTVQLLRHPALIGEKVQEEAEEVARAAREESDERVANEAADVLYHLTVLLASRDLTLADAERVLDARSR